MTGVVYGVIVLGAATVGWVAGIVFAYSYVHRWFK